MTSHRILEPSRRLLNKVPEVTIYFWIVKVLCTTVGETGADFLNMNLNFGLTGTSIVTGILLAIALVVQFRTDRYVPVAYWSAVALISVFGTLVTDNMTDSIGVPLEASTLMFSVLLAVTFAAWYRSERTLSIHSIVTRRREAFYWLTILFAFALGTAAGDLMAEVLGLGYLVTGAIVVSVVAVTALAWRFGAHPVLAFWIIYILTRPLGASVGDYLTQSSSQGGLGLGATLTSVIFVVGIVGIVTYLSVTKVDLSPAGEGPDRDRVSPHGGRWQTAVAVALLLVAGGTGYFLRTSALQADVSASAAVSAPHAPVSGGSQQVAASPLGDLSEFRTITQDTLLLLNAGNQDGATTRVTDLETAWDNAEAHLKPRSRATWTEIDGKIDTVLRELRATSPTPDREKNALSTLLDALR